MNFNLHKFLFRTGMRLVLHFKCKLEDSWIMSKILTVVWNTINEVNFCIVCIVLATMNLELGAWKSCLLLVFLNMCKLIWIFSMLSTTKHNNDSPSPPPLSLSLYIYIYIYIHGWVKVYWIPMSNLWCSTSRINVELKSFTHCTKWVLDVS